MTQPIAKRFPAPSIDTLPEDIRTRLLVVQPVGRISVSVIRHEAAESADQTVCSETRV
jgi:hypothetical protein